MPNPCATYKTLQVAFVPPAIAPANGYLVKWRVVGDTTWNTSTQYGNPVQIAGVPACYNIEGTIQADCGNDNYGNPVNFAVSGTVTTCYNFELLDSANYTYVPCGSSIPATYTNNSATPTTVCAVDGTVSGGAYTRTTQCSV